jgi:DNA-binding beta-propeller fold protein YncE
MALDSDNNILYVSDQSNNRIRKINLATGVTSLVAGSSAGYAEGVGSNTQFNYPYALALDKANQALYVSDNNNYKIRKIDLATNTTSLLVGSARGYADGVGVAAQFYDLGGGLVIDEANQALYMTDYNNYSALRKIDIPSRTVTTLTTNYPYALALDATNGVMYYTVLNNGYYIGKYDLKTRVNTLISGSSSSNFSEGAGLASRYRSPYGISLDTTG